MPNILELFKKKGNLNEFSSSGRLDTVKDTRWLRKCDAIARQRDVVGVCKVLFDDAFLCTWYLSSAEAFGQHPTYRNAMGTSTVHNWD